MKENMPSSKPTPEQPEKKQERKEKIESLKDILKISIENFLSRSDDPGEYLSEKEKIELSKKAAKNPESLEEWNIKKRGSKYRLNSLSIPLAAGEIFLESEESLDIPLKDRQDLLERIKEARILVKEGYGKPYTAFDIKKVVEIANDLKKYL